MEFMVCVKFLVDSILACTGSFYHYYFLLLLSFHIETEFLDKSEIKKPTEHHVNSRLPCAPSEGSDADPASSCVPNALESDPPSSTLCPSSDSSQAQSLPSPTSEDGSISSMSEGNNDGKHKEQTDNNQSLALVDVGVSVDVTSASKKESSHLHTRPTKEEEPGEQVARRPFFRFTSCPPEIPECIPSTPLSTKGSSKKLMHWFKSRSKSVDESKQGSSLKGKKSGSFLRRRLSKKRKKAKEVTVGTDESVVCTGTTAEHLHVEPAEKQVSNFSPVPISSSATPVESRRASSSSEESQSSHILHTGCESGYSSSEDGEYMYT